MSLTIAKPREPYQRRYRELQAGASGGGFLVARWLHRRLYAPADPGARNR